MPLYPLKFRPLFIPKIWGGRRLQDVLGKPLPAGISVGESWELYDFPAGVVNNSTEWVSAVVANGPLVGRSLHSLVQEFGPELLNDVPLVGPDGQFPILIKFLDAREDLSVQVHPDEAYAAANVGAHLKSEAWYILQHEPGAAIYKGLKPGTTREQFKEAIERGTVMDHVVRIPVRVGQTYYLPSGTVHALGAGVLVAEVQTPSDTTFRLFDFNRVDESTGHPRQLHVEQALDCIDFSGAVKTDEAPGILAGSLASVTSLVTSPYFNLSEVRMGKCLEKPLQHDKPVILIMVQGEAQITGADLKEPTAVSHGDTVLLPARMKQPVIRTFSDCAWLEVTFPATK